MKYIYFLITSLLFISCEDIINLPLTEGQKRLVIDANINWEKGTLGNEQSIRLTETTGFYDTEIPAVHNAIVKITDSNSKEFIFTEDGNTGVYKINSFEPKIDETYTLNIIHNNETFTASETLKPITSIIEVEQSVQNIFGKDVVRVDFKFIDPIAEENYYLAGFSSSAYLLNVYRVWRDEFINGNEDTVFEIDEDLKTDDTLTLEFYGISKLYHNYISLLLQQTESNGPFGTPPASVKGNCINTTNTKNKPLGYFRLSEVVKITYTIE